MTYPNDPETPRRDPVPPNEPIRPGDPDYREGYVNGQKVEGDRLFVEEQRVRDNDNAARGLLIGIVLASLVGLGLAWYFLTQRDEEPVQQIIVPGNTTPAPSPSVTERVIERETNIIQPPSTQPAPASPAAPNINIRIPSSQPSQSAAPAPEINNNITVPPAPAPQSGAPTTPTGPSDVAPGDAAPATPSSPAPSP